MTDNDNTPRGALLPLSVAADVQDDLLAADCDLERLLGLLDDCHAGLQGGFFAALEALAPLSGPDAERVRACLVGAVKSLQFQDMSSQLVGHTRRRLRSAAERVARAALVEDGDADASIDDTPLRPNPVAQTAMNTGFVELF